MLTQTNVVIANGETVQDGYVDLRENILVGIHMPTDWTAGDITFRAAARADTGGVNDEDFVSVIDADGAAIAVVAAADQHVVISPNAFQGVEFLQLVSENAQGADRVIKVILTRRPVG